jgi:hypothetical protein
MLLKWLLLFAFAYVAYRWWSQISPSSRGKNTQVGSEQMLTCEQCGVHFPQSEAVIDQEVGTTTVFCCEKHRISWKQSH